MVRYDILRGGVRYGTAEVDGAWATVTIWSDEDGNDPQTFTLRASELEQRIAAIPGSELVDVSDG